MKWAWERLPLVSYCAVVEGRCLKPEEELTAEVAGCGSGQKVS